MFCAVSFYSQNVYSQCSVLYMSSVTTGAGAADQCDPADPLHEQFTICYEVCPNCGVVPDIDIGGMQIFDNTGTSSIRYTFPAGTMLAPGGCVTVEAGDPGMACPVWNNGGDCLLMMGAPADVDVVLSVLYGGTSDPDCTGAPNTINGSDAGGGVFTLSVADALDCTQCVTDPPTGMPTITEASCGADCTQVDGSIEIGSLACPGGSGNIQYSTDGGTTWSPTLPAYDQAAPVSFTASCSCDDTQTIGPFMTSPQSCPTVDAPAGGSITDSTCPAGDATPSGGAIVDPTCATGTLNWSETAGGPYSATAPTYNQAGPAQTFYAVCIDAASGCTSPEFTLGTTTPGVCAALCDPAIAAATPMVTIDSESTCAMAGGTLMGGAISAATCPTGSTVEYSTDGGGSWSATLPTYDQNNSISVMARCVCDADMTMIGTGMAVTTTPGTCPPPAEVCNACDCTAAPNSYTINTVADNGSQAGYTLTYTLTGNSDPLETDTPAAGAPASFPGLVDNMPYDVCAFNVLDADLAAFQAALTNEAAVADAIAGAGAFMTLCYTQVCVTFPAESCDCCPDISAIMMGEGQICNSGDTANITVDIVGGVGPYTVVYNDGSTNTTLTGYNSAAPITVMPTSNTPGNTIFTYTLVSVTDANGCTSTVAGTGTVTVTMSCANAGSLNGSGN